MELVKDMKRRKCHDCGVELGEYHLEGCDTERCPKCAGQLISCGCFVIYKDLCDFDDEGRWDVEEFEKYEREKWTGIMYEEAHLYAEEHDLWVRWGPPWIKCDRNHPDAKQDLNTSVVEIMNNFKPTLKK